MDKGERRKWILETIAQVLGLGWAGWDLDWTAIGPLSAGSYSRVRFSNGLSSKIWLEGLEREREMDCAEPRFATQPIPTCQSQQK